MASKPTRKTLSAKQLVVDFDLNIRDRSNYDLGTMKDQIRTAGQVIKPILVEKQGDRYVVLSGNRRTLASQELLTEESLPANLKASLEKLDVLVYEGLSETERLALVIDHGSEKGISRTELVQAVWRLAKAFWSEIDIIKLLYFSLAQYTGAATKKLPEIQKITDEKQRTEALRKWLHGTVGNYMLAAAKMGTYVREQFILTHKSQDNMLAEGEKVEVNISRDRIVELSKARTADEANGGWSTEKGGTRFNELLERYKAEDAGNATKERSSRPSAKDLLDRIDVFKSQPMKRMLRLAAEGPSEQTKGLDSDDDAIYRNEQIFSAVMRNVEKVPKGTPLDAFIGLYLHGTPGQMQEFFDNLSK